MHTIFKSKLEELNQGLHALLTDLKGISDEKLNEKPGENEWSIAEVMQHLMTSERLSLQYVRKKTSFQKDFKATGLITLFRKIILNTFLWMPLKFKAPPAVATSAFEPNLSYSELSRQWLEIRESTSGFLETVPKEWLGKEIYRHPLAGRLSLDGMLEFFHNHFKRHRKQINRTLEKVGA